MEKFRLLAPTFARYTMLILGARLASGGVLPPEIASAIGADPTLVEGLAGLYLQAFAVLWFAFSRARKAITEKAE